MENRLQVFVPGQGRAYVAEGCVENRLQVCAPGRARGKSITGFCTGAGEGLCSGRVRGKTTTGLCPGPRSWKNDYRILYRGRACGKSTTGFCTGAGTVYRGFVPIKDHKSLEFFTRLFQQQLTMLHFNFVLRYPRGTFEDKNVKEFRESIGAKIVATGAAEEINEYYDERFRRIMSVEEYEYMYILFENGTSVPQLEGNLFNKWGPGHFSDSSGRMKWKVFVSTGCEDTEELLIYYYILRTAQRKITEKMNKDAEPTDSELVEKGRKIMELQLKLEQEELAAGNLVGEHEKSMKEVSTKVAVLEEQVRDLKMHLNNESGIALKAGLVVSKLVERLLKCKGAGSTEVFMAAMSSREELKAIREDYEKKKQSSSSNVCSIVVDDCDVASGQKRRALDVEVPDTAKDVPGSTKRTKEGGVPVNLEGPVTAKDVLAHTKSARRKREAPKKTNERSIRKREVTVVKTKGVHVDPGLPNAVPPTYGGLVLQNSAIDAMRRGQISLAGMGYWPGGGGGYNQTVHAVWGNMA